MFVYTHTHPLLKLGYLADHRRVLLSHSLLPQHPELLRVSVDVPPAGQGRGGEHTDPPEVAVTVQTEMSVCNDNQHQHHGIAIIVMIKFLTTR